MEYPQLAVMNISHRYFDLEEFFSSAAASGYTCCELWTGAMHLYVDCHGYDSLEQVRELSQRYGVRIVGICPEQNNPKPWNIATRGEESRARRSHTLRMSWILRQSLAPTRSWFRADGHF